MRRCRAFVVLFAVSALNAETFGASPDRAASDASERKEGALSYQTEIRPTADGAVNAAMAASSLLLSLEHVRKIDAGILAGRVRGDYARLEGALRSQGYYAGTVSIRLTVNGRDYDGKDPSLPDQLQTLPPGATVKIVVAAELGRQFRLGRIALRPFAEAQETDPPRSSPRRPSLHPAALHPASSRPVAREAVSLTEREKKAFGLVAGQKAVAAEVIAASGRLLNCFQEEGYALAKVSAPQAILHPQDETVEILFHVHKGPVTLIGPIRFNGLKRTRPSFIRRRLMVREGQLYQPSEIDRAREDLGRTGVFSSIQAQSSPPLVTLPPKKSSVPGVTDAMPVAFNFKESKYRRIEGEAGYSTDLGGRAGVSWTHRNLLGRAEKLRLTALVTGLGGSAQQGIGYDLYADLTKPDFMKKGRDLHGRVEAIRQLLYSYSQTAFLLQGGFSQSVGRHWSLGGGLSVEQERIRQFGTSRDYFIVSLPLQASYDNTGLSNPVEPATHGLRASISLTPSESLEHSTSFFTVMSAQVSTYLDLSRLGLSRPGRSVIALRGIVGSVQGASTLEIPPDQRLYAGGPATVRGFRYQGVGPQYRNTKYAIGGTSLDAGTVEFRQRLFKSFGAVAFADAGQVGTSSVPGHGRLRIGYGAGVRYFTPIGPVRVDVALPANRPSRGDKWELYIGLGETF